MLKVFRQDSVLFHNSGNIILHKIPPQFIQNEKADIAKYT